MVNWHEELNASCRRSDSGVRHALTTPAEISNESVAQCLVTGGHALIDLFELGDCCGSCLRGVCYGLLGARSVHRAHRPVSSGRALTCFRTSDGRQPFHDWPDHHMLGRNNCNLRCGASQDFVHESWSAVPSPATRTRSVP